MDTYTALSLKENLTIWSMMTIFAVLWVALMIYLPAIVIVGYFSVVAAIVATLWMFPRDTSTKIDSDFVKVN